MKAYSHSFSKQSCIFLPAHYYALDVVCQKCWAHFKSSLVTLRYLASWTWSSITLAKVYDLDNLCSEQARDKYRDQKSTRHENVLCTWLGSHGEAPSKSFQSAWYRGGGLSNPMRFLGGTNSCGILSSIERVLICIEAETRPSGTDTIWLKI